MGISQVGLSVCNDGNVAQLDCTDIINGGVYYRIEVYRCSQPSGGYGVTLSGSRVEDIAAIDHLTPRSNQVFRYFLAVGDEKTHRGSVPILLEGREEFNPPGMPDGSWDVRVRDLDHKSPTYGAILRATAAPSADGYDLHYEFRVPTGAKPVAIFSPLHRKITELNPTLIDIGTPLDQHPSPLSLSGSNLTPLSKGAPAPKPLSIRSTMKTVDVDGSFQAALEVISHPQFEHFRKNLDLYEAFGDFGAKATHPGTNLTGPNATLAAESIFVRQYRAALILTGRLSSPEMARGAITPKSLADASTNPRPGVYAVFVGAAINEIGIYKLGLDKVHSDYGGVPMKLAPGSALENGAVPVADARRCNETLGQVANLLYLNK